MVTPLKQSVLLNPSPPNLPVAPIQYTQQYQDQVLNVLRLYFNQMNNVLGGLIAADAGDTASRPSNYVNGVNKLAVGTMYFDTTRGIPCWWNGTVWINASGTTV